MAIEDYFDPYSYDDREDQQPKKCRFCGKGNLAWEDDNGKWVLVDQHTTEIHRCQKLKTKPNIDIDKLLNEKIK